MPQNTVVGADVLQLMSELGCVEPPPCPRDIRLWLDSQEATSAMLRPPSVTSRHGSIFPHFSSLLFGKVNIIEKLFIH